MKIGFTLIELLVAVTIVAVVSGGSLLYLNKFNSGQILQKNIDEVVSVLKLAQSYAKTRQLPFGSSETELKFVQVKVTPSGYLELRANSDIGPTYSNILVNSGIISVGSTPAVIYFWAGTGSLSKDAFGTNYSSEERAQVNVWANGDINDESKIFLDSMGQVLAY